MEQEEKLQYASDLCARVPYGLVVEYLGEPRRVLAVYPHSWRIELGNSPYMHQTVSIDEVNPYYRSMTDITDEELEELGIIPEICNHIFRDNELPLAVPNSRFLNWIYEHNFDFNGFIKKGLAKATTIKNNE